MKQPFSIKNKSRNAKSSLTHSLDIHEVTTEEVVLFFNDQKICKQINATDFKAMLEGLVQEPRFSSQTIKSAFVTVTPSLIIKSIVLFYCNYSA